MCVASDSKHEWKMGREGGVRLSSDLHVTQCTALGNDLSKPCSEQGTHAYAVIHREFLSADRHIRGNWGGRVE